MRAFLACAADDIGAFSAVLFGEQGAVGHGIAEQKWIVLDRNNNLLGEAIAMLGELWRENVQEIAVRDRQVFQ